MIVSRPPPLFGRDREDVFAGCAEPDAIARAATRAAYERTDELAKQAAREYLKADRAKRINAALGKKSDDGKLPLHLIAPSMILDVARVLQFGAGKYGERNWEQGIAWSRVYSAALRHLIAWYDGENADDETGYSHLAHALCCLMFLNEYRATHPELDDRPRGGVPS